MTGRLFVKNPHSQIQFDLPNFSKAPDSREMFTWKPNSRTQRGGWRMYLSTRRYVSVFQTLLFRIIFLSITRVRVNNGHPAWLSLIWFKWNWWKCRKKKHDEQRISIVRTISIFDETKKLWINLWCTILIRHSCSAWKMSLPASIKTESNFVFAHAEPTMNYTFRGISIDWSDDNENADDSIRFNLEIDSNTIVESESQHKKHDE
jgi:hypothetical protein